MQMFNVAIVGGGSACVAFMEMINTGRHPQLRMNIIGVADINPNAPGMRYAGERGIFTTTDFHDLFSLGSLNLILELTGKEEIGLAIQREKPAHIQFMDHTVSRLFWDITHLSEEKLIPESEAQKQIKAVSQLFMDVIDLEEERQVALKKAEERIKAERDNTFQILNSLAEAVVVVDKDLKIDSANETFRRTFGGACENVLGESCLAVVFKRYGLPGSSFRDLVTSTMETLKTNREEFRFESEGKTTYTECIFIPIRDDKGQYSRCLVSIGDITHHKRLELDLEKSRKKYKNLFQDARDGIILFEKTGKIQETNLSLERMLGYGRDELEHMMVADLAEETSGKILSEHLEALEIMGFVSVELDFIKKDGDPLPVEANISWLPEEEIFQILARDITVRKKLDESRKLYSEKLEKEVQERTKELRESQQEALRQQRNAEGIISGSPIPMYVLDRNHKVTYWNQAMENLTGFSSEEMIGTDKHWKTFFRSKKPLMADFIIENDIEAIQRRYEGMHLRKSAMVDGGYEVEDFIEHLGEGGTHLYINAAPIKDDEGIIQGAIVTYRDVTERVRMTREIHDSREEAIRQQRNAEGIIYGSPIPMFVLDGDHKVSYWNQAMENLTGFSSEAMIGTDKHWSPFYPQKRPMMADLIIENDIETIHKLYKDMNLRKSPMVEGAYEAEHYFEHLGEEGTHLYFNAAPIKDDQGDIQGAIVTYQDFSERVKMTQEIRRREAFVQNLIQNSIDGIIATDEQGKIVIFNQGAMDILGYDPTEIALKKNYLDIIMEESARKIRNAFYGEQHGPKGKIINMETELLNKEAEPIPLRLSGTLLFEEGKEVGSVVFIQDLREIHRLQKEKEQAERMAAIGQTVSGLAHYIKNILNGLKGGEYVINSAMKKQDMDLVAKGWRIVEKNIDQISTIVLDMLVYSKERKPDYKPVDPNELVTDVLDLMKERAERAGVTLIPELMTDLKEVAMDRTAIHRCLLNLVSNAIDACTLEGIMSGNGIVKVKTDTPEDGAIRFQVVDNGMGMDEKVQKKIFTGFFSTKGYQGTGLGLPVTQKIVREHNGNLAFESAPGKGTTFTLILPGVSVE